ncbi:GTP-binding protein YPT52 [Tritrichomonas foetus]|uniref:GTP-binding protein YPT52 n=1 Tax=Tritrichomonas foetus TaxID=1144522 RepID=A0A1J4L195_9EUKA|nr:GTP-binding protein YPT52 [Tritrichomonas foetus]|eukprot:OHT17211.1 GTP-binding protein YPT52 [Tritrichomonas foetus]
MQFPTQSSTIYKVVFMGDSGVGKTSIVQRINTSKFDINLDSTIGAAAISKDVQTSQGVISLSIWDTAGQERYRSLISTYARNANAAILCFDLSSYASFQSLESWVDELNKFCSNECLVFIVGNKADLQQHVPFPAINEWCESRQYKLFITSAKDGHGIEELVQVVGEDVVNSACQTLDNHLVLSGTKSKGCC